MSTLESQLKDLKDSVHMSTAEHATLKESLHEYMAMSPVRTATTALSPTTTGNVKSLFIQVLSYKFMPALLVLAMLVSSGVGVAYASESALPGERLYKVKEITEEAYAQVLIGNSARANWAERRAERRVQEAQRLSELGRLSEERIVMIEARIKKHSQHAEVALAKLEKLKPAKAIKVRKALEQKKVRIQNIRETHKEIHILQKPVLKKLEVRAIKKNIGAKVLKRAQKDSTPRKKIGTTQIIKTKVQEARKERKSKAQRIQNIKRIQYDNPPKVR